MGELASRPTTWVCQACGKYGPARGSFGDESCYMWSVECYTDSLQYGGLTGKQVTKGQAVTSE